MEGRMFKNEVMKKAREKKGFSQVDLLIDLARHGVRVSPTTVSNWESGKTEPKGSRAFFIAKILGIPFSKLFA